VLRLEPMKIQTNISLRDKNWFRTGGHARYFAQPKTEKEFASALAFARVNKLKLEILGSGANVLVSDDGFDGLVISPSPITKAFSATGNLVTALAGATIQECIDWCLEHNLLGLEEFSGIPGTIGGGVYMNVHYFKFFLASFLAHASVIHKKTGKIKTVDMAWFNFGYDQSKLQEKEWFLLSATFRLEKGTDLETAYAKGRRDEIIRQRNSRYPSERTCGSFFRNFHDHELATVKNAQKLPFVAYYLDQLGIKGKLQHGGAVVSYKHANMIVTQENATSHDIVMLAQHMQELVLKKFGILPQSECQFIGFNRCPLLHNHDIQVNQHQTYSQSVKEK